MAIEDTSAVEAEAGASADRMPLEDLAPALRRLDRLIERALAAAQHAYGAEAAADAFRGLHISEEETRRLLAREPGSPAFHIGGSENFSPGALCECARLGWLAQAFGLSPFDQNLVLIALAPELDLRYERLYAYLQDDVSRRRPAVDLALNLLCESSGEKLARRAHFGSDAPLIQHGLLHLIADPNQVQPPLLAHSIKLDEQIVRFLLGHAGLDARLAPFCQIVKPIVSVDEGDDTQRRLKALVLRKKALREPLRMYFQGSPGSGQRRTAEALACEVGSPLLVVDMAQALAGASDYRQAIRVAFRQAWLDGANLYLDGLDALRGDEREPHYHYLMSLLAEDEGITILAGAKPWVPWGHRPMGVIQVSFGIPDVFQRRAAWRSALAEHGLTLKPDDLDALGDRFRLTPGQIADAVATAGNHRIQPAAGQPLPTDETGLEGDLFRAARAQSGHALASLARKVEAKYTWGDIVLPDDTLAQLREICQRVAHRHQVMDEWGFDRKLSLGKGVNVLFAGPSGTGKTMAAEILANELGLDLYTIDLSGVVSKYIGETEKNLDRIFTAAESANAILFFDEADALFGKRSEVRDSHDRYANIEISYLLQKMEQFEGIVILATNRRDNLDDSFARRLAFSVHFPLPDETDRRRIWQSIWPSEVPLDPGVSFDDLARRFKLSGGSIKNIAVASAFLAAADGGRVRTLHLLHAARREYQSLGKVLPETEADG
jgi:AAA+ superfamily predicted ATPase